MTSPGEQVSQPISPKSSQPSNGRANKKTKNGSSWFNRFATKVAHFSGHPTAFCTAALIVILWAISGPFMGFSEVWQLTINTGTTIITFLMVFIIQSTQNRDTTSIQIKLDELIRATEAARNSMLNLEELSEEELEKLRQRYVALADQTSEELEDAKEEKAREGKAPGTR